MILCISSCKYSESFLVLLSTSLKIVRGQTDLSYESQVHGIDWITVNSGWQKHGYIDTQSEHFGLREWFQWQGLSKALASLWNVTDIIMQESILVSRFKDFFLVVWVSVRFVWKMFSLSYTCSLQWMPTNPVHYELHGERWVLRRPAAYSSYKGLRGSNGPTSHPTHSRHAAPCKFNLIKETKESRRTQFSFQKDLTDFVYIGPSWSCRHRHRPAGVRARRDPRWTLHPRGDPGRALRSHRATNWWPHPGNHQA